jgi:alkanesulfonate monooxygenase SsuD/methylene tetrahydromethanopterin reductase-like flavin-dependent oxidoreductase (luciferase family)
VNAASVRLGRIGVWLGAFSVASADEAHGAAQEIDAIGYDTLWYPEGLGNRESFTNGAVLLAATERIRIASGIANTWGRDAVAAANAARVLADAWTDRFLLGLGVSHPRQVDPRGHRYEKPVARIVDNLRWLGFKDADFEEGGSDALVHALVVAGDEEAIRERVQEHLAAGATQVAIHPLEDGDPFGLETLRRLAPLLLA